MDDTKLNFLADQVAYAAWLVGENASDPDPIPTTPVVVNEVIVRVTMKISSGLSRTSERRVLRSYNPSAPSERNHNDESR